MKIFEIDNVIQENENIALSKHLHTKDEPMHSHKFLEISYVFSGCGYQNINGEQSFVKRGDLMVFLLKDEHSFSPQDSIGIYNCYISPQFLSEKFTNSLNAVDILTLTAFSAFTLDNINTLFHCGQNYREIENIFEAMEREFLNKETGYIQILHNYLEILLTKIFRLQQNNSSINLPEEIGKITPEILKYIENHYNQKITLTKLAQMSFYSPSYFSRIFKECYNTTLTDFVLGLRIDKAIVLLKETNKSVEDIAESVGYSDMKTFYKAFKKITGTTPKNMRLQKFV